MIGSIPIAEMDRFGALTHPPENSKNLPNFSPSTIGRAIDPMNSKLETKYPDCYLHVLECRSGTTWVVPIRGNGLLDLRHQLKRWVKREFCGELKLDGALMPKLEGEYYGKIMTDGRPPDSVICWDGAGFYLAANS